MTHREQVLAVLAGEKLDVAPCLGECPMDVTVFRDLMPAAAGDPVQDAIAFAEFFDNAAVDIGIGLRQETLSRDESHHCYRYETGAVWHEQYEPSFNREATAFPINTPKEALAFTMPDAGNPSRLDDAETRRRVEAFHEVGYCVQGGVMGAWLGIYYYLTSFENILLWHIIHGCA